MQKAEDILKKVYQKRGADVKKYDFGLVLVIGGGEFYTGSPALSAMAALKTGADMTHVLAPERAADIIAGFSPNLACLPFKGKWFDQEDLASLLSMTASAQAVSHNKTAVVIGGGMGRSPETQQTIIEYLKQIDIKAVIDADAIRALGLDLSCIKGKPFLITPHSNEFTALGGQDIKTLKKQEKEAVLKILAQRLKTTILLKGKTDIIASEKGETGFNELGSPYMTKGGTGDTLAGIAGALLARGLNCFEAGLAAAALNGKAGQLASSKLKDAMLATDLIDQIPEAISSFHSFF